MGSIAHGTMFCKGGLRGFPKKAVWAVEGGERGSHLLCGNIDGNNNSIDKTHDKINDTNNNQQP